MLKRKIQEYSIPALIFVLSLIAIIGCRPSIASAASESQVRITEIMYDPLGSGDKEFIELYNGSDSTADMSGWSFSSGVNYTFASGAKLEPGRYGVVVRNSAIFRNSYPNARVMGQYIGKLVGRGELIRLTDKGGASVSEVNYASGGGWPSQPRNGGPSLSLIRTNANETMAGCWGSSTAPGGSPGFTNSSTGGGGCSNKSYPVTPLSTPVPSGGGSGGGGNSGSQPSGGGSSSNPAKPSEQPQPSGGTGDQELQNITAEKQAELDKQSEQEVAEDDQLETGAKLGGLAAGEPVFKKAIGAVLGVFVIFLGVGYIALEKLHKKKRKHGSILGKHFAKLKKKFIKINK